jgi:hypothetical protein
MPSSLRRLKLGLLIVLLPALSGCGKVTGYLNWFSSENTRQLVFEVQPNGAAAGSNFSQHPVVAILDSKNKVVIAGPDASAQVTLTVSNGTGALNGTTVSVHAVNGIADFDSNFSVLSLSLGRSGSSANARCLVQSRRGLGL